jgi:hypothetical protein
MVFIGLVLMLSIKVCHPVDETLPEARHDEFALTQTGAF